MQHNQFFTHEDLYVVGTQKNGLNEIDSTRHALTDDKKVIGIVRLTFACLDMSRDMRLPTLWYVRQAKPPISLPIRAV